MEATHCRHHHLTTSSAAIIIIIIIIIIITAITITIVIIIVILIHIRPLPRLRQDFKGQVRRYRYVELDGKWRLMPEKLKTQILDTALTVVTAHGWPLKAVDGPSLLEEVQKTLPDGEVSVASLGVLQKALASVVATSPGADAPQEGEEAGSSTFNLDPQKISGFRALQILREDPQEVRRRYELPPPVPQKVGIKRPRLAKTVMPGSGALQVDEFLQIFKELTNTEMTSDQVLQAVCEGSAYVDEFEGTIHALDATTLPRVEA
ncbi:unnamed protein product [Symbiodinium microadriaticum]|nr:unnamed protein product [Symbiodinium microadriaticum]